MTEEEPETPTARRQRAHDELDRYLDELLAGEEAAIASDDAHKSRELYRLGLVFVERVIGHGVREAAAPKVVSNSPSEIRKALIAILYLLWPVWPTTSRPAGWGPFSASIWPGDIIQALEKLNGGETMPIFEAPKRPGKQGWTERRFHFLAVFWAINLERREGYDYDEANNLVANAFNPAISRDTPAAVRAYDPNAGKVIIRARGLPQGSLGKWRRHIEKVAQGKVFDEAIPGGDAVIGIQLASSPASESAAGVGPWDAESRAQILHFVAFGQATGGSKSLAEAGSRYQDFKRLK